MTKKIESYYLCADGLCRMMGRLASHDSACCTMNFGMWAQMIRNRLEQGWILWLHLALLSGRIDVRARAEVAFQTALRLLALALTIYDPSLVVVHLEVAVVEEGAHLLSVGMSLLLHLENLNRSISL